MKTCFLFGHANTPHNVRANIEKAIETYYVKYQIRDFYVGSRGNFDSLAAAAVKQLKTQHPDIHLYLLLAYHPAERPVALTEGFDNSFYPPLEKVPKQYAIVRANRYMVDTADSVICYVQHPGNARNLLEHARWRQREQRLIVENVTEKSGVRGR